MLPVSNVTLTFSFVGYAPKEIAAQGQNTVNVMLSSDLQDLEEVVVVGYGTQKKLNLTAAVDQVTSETLENRPVPNVHKDSGGNAQPEYQAP